MQGLCDTNIFPPAKRATMQRQYFPLLFGCSGSLSDTFRSIFRLDRLILRFLPFRGGRARNGTPKPARHFIVV